MVIFRGCCGAVVLNYLLILLMATLISANAINVAPGPQTSGTPVSSLTNCDGVGTFFCPTGTCYTGYDGFVGCCSVSSCAARTTCIPYTTSATPTCDVNTGGCVVCSVNLPACVTIINAFNHQYVMYCDSDPILETISYTNLITTGSMALLPGQTITPSAIMTSTTAIPATRTDASLTTTVATVAAAVTGSTVAEDIGVSKGVVAGITVGSVVGLVALVGIAFMLLKTRRRRERAMIQCVPYDKPGPFEIPDSSRPSTNTASATTPRRLQKPPGLRVRSMVTTTDANNLDDYISPIARDRLARQAEAHDAARANELDGANPSPYMDLEGQVKDIWSPPATCPNAEANPSARWSVNNAPGVYKAYQPSNNLDSRISELSSIRHVQPSGSHDPSPPSSESPAVSPNPSNYVNTPPVGGVSPLMDKWHADDRASVGEPSATVNGPINWFSPTHVQSRSPSSSHVVPESSKLTSATGAGAAYVSPETAMAEGYSAGHDERD